MKCMARNKSKFFFALYKGKARNKSTGKYEVTYENPIEYAANISAAKGETSTRQFGDTESYDKVIVMDSDAPKIDEYSILWVDTVPQVDDTGSLVLNEDGEIITPHDYVVKKVARSLNSVSIAISKVNVDG